MKKAIKCLAVLMAATFMTFNSGFLATAADNGEQVSIAGVLKVSKKKNGNKTQVMPYIQNGETKTFIKFEIANKGQRPSLKQYHKKRIVIKGIGTQKVIKEKTFLVLTKVDSIEEVESTKPAETAGEEEEVKTTDDGGLE